MKDRPSGSIDDLIAEIAGIPIEELAKEPTKNGRHLISVDELRAAGALDVPASWRTSLGVERDRYLSLFDEEEDDCPGAQSPTSDEVEDSGPATE